MTYCDYLAYYKFMNKKIKKLIDVLRIFQPNVLK